MKNPIAKYLMCSYAYYKEDNPLISDQEFDDLAKFILENYNAIDHPHKHLITSDHLSAGTGYDIAFPSIVKSCVHEILYR